MLKIALCDDDALQIEILQELLYDYNSVSQHKVEVSAFLSAKELLSAVSRNGRFDIYILDIMMPELDGLDLAKLLRDNGDIGKIVFLSAETSFVYKAFSVSASGYLVKPVNPEELFELIDSLRAKIEKERPSFVQVSTVAGERRLEVKDILFIDMLDRTPVYHLINGMKVEGRPRRCKFQEMVSELLSGYSFALCSVGVAVNLANVESLKRESSEIVMKNGQTLFCSRTMKEHFAACLEAYWNM